MILQAKLGLTQDDLAKKAVQLISLVFKLGKIAKALVASIEDLLKYGTSFRKNF